MLSTRKGALAAAALSLLALACENEIIEPAEAPQRRLPTLAPEYSAGHWSVEQRGVPLDADDFAVIIKDSTAGLSPSRLEADFGLLVLNLPYVDAVRVGVRPINSDPTAACVSVAEAEMVKPRATAERFLEALRSEKEVTFDRIAVNVDLLTANRGALLQQCFELGTQVRTFAAAEHRAGLIAAFEDLAGLPSIAYITVGLEMNSYYHLRDDEGRPHIDDYANFVALYREIYRAIKAVNPKVQVGPGISWAVLQRQTVPAMVEEFRLEAADPSSRLEAVWRAWQRTIEPLLNQTTVEAGKAQRTPTADYLGVTMIPRDNEPPFTGTAELNDENREAILAHYRPLPLVADGRFGMADGEADPEAAGPSPTALPIALVQIDWRVTSNTVANVKKTQFLATLKEATSHADIAWAAWRRLSDLPDVQMVSKCDSYTQQAGHGPDYCLAGMITESGASRTTLCTFTCDDADACKDCD